MQPLLSLVLLRLFLTDEDASSRAYRFTHVVATTMAVYGGQKGQHGSDGSDACCAAGNMQPLLSLVLAAVLLVGAAAAPEEYNILQDLSNTCQANLAASQAVETACGSGRYQSTLNLNLLNTGGAAEPHWRRQHLAASTAAQPCRLFRVVACMSSGHWRMVQSHRSQPAACFQPVAAILQRHIYIMRSKALWPCSSISASGCLLEMPQLQGSSTLQLSDRSCSCDCSTYHCTPQLTEAPGW